MKRWAELAGAITLLTRLPMVRFTSANPPPAACLWAYPLVGLIVGGIGAAVLSGSLALRLPQPIAALLAVAATVLVTGGLHEDGLADMADGFGGGRTVERKLSIMRDSRIGSFGTLALLFSVMLRGTATALSPHPGLALVVAAVLGRGAMLLPLAFLRPARADGLAAEIGGRSRVQVGVGLAITAIAGVISVQAVGASLIAALAVTRLAVRQIGGYTGDVLGATEQVAECAALAVLA